METNSGDFYKLDVSNSKNQNIALEIKFSKHMNIFELKKKLEIITGGNCSTMKVSLYKGDKQILLLNDDSVILGSLSICPGVRLHVEDNFNEINCEKFELTDDQYSQRTDSVRNFLIQNNFGKYNDKKRESLLESRSKSEKLEMEKAELCTVGARCQVNVQGKPLRRGVVMYKGLVSGLPGVYIGVKYDEPVGKNDGTYKSIRYFECDNNYGGFVLPSAVECGNFSPLDIDFDEI